MNQNFFPKVKNKLRYLQFLEKVDEKTNIKVPNASVNKFQTYVPEHVYATFIGPNELCKLFQMLP